VVSKTIGWGFKSLQTCLKVNIMQKIIQYLKDVRLEMIKVSWPTRHELFGATVLVIALSLMMAVFVYACDQVINRLVGLLLQINL
jgi:preprotein translocase subunit SecE